MVIYIDRRVFIGLLAAILFGAPSRAFPQGLAKLPRIGVLIGASPPYPFADAFRRGLYTLGYSEGQNIALEFRYTMGRSDRAAELAAELVGLSVDVIVTHWTQATRAAMGATKTIPIVMVVGSPLQSGFVDSLARPGGNATGLSGMDAEIGGKRLQILRELMPSLARVAVLGTTPATNPYSSPFVEDLRLAAARAGLRLEPVLISGPDELESAFANMARAGAQAVIVQEHFDSHRAILVKLAAKHRLAYMSGTRETTVAGGLVSISANWPALYERAAFYVDKIIKGAKPANLPVEQPTKFQVVLNMKRAQALGLTPYHRCSHKSMRSSSSNLLRVREWEWTGRPWSASPTIAPEGDLKAASLSRGRSWLSSRASSSSCSKPRRKSGCGTWVSAARSNQS